MPALIFLTEEMAEGKNAILLGMSQWNSNDLVEQIETIGKLDEHRGETLLLFCQGHVLHGGAGHCGPDWGFLCRFLSLNPFP